MQKTILENSFDVIISFDKDLKITNMSNVAFDKFNLSPDESIGNHIYSIFPTLEKEQYVNIELRVLTNKENVEISPLNIKIADSQFAFNGKLLPLVEGDETYGGIFILQELKETNSQNQSYNIYQDKKIQQKYYQFLFNNISTAVVYLDEQFYFREGNQCFFELFDGYTAEDLVGVNVEDVTHEKFHERNRSVIQSIFKGEIVSNTYENIYFKKSGEEINTIDHIIGMYDDEGMFEGAIGIISDITAVKETELKLIEANKQLSSFAHKISHDLKEPLNSIHLFSKLLATAVQNNLFPEEKDYLNFIIDGSKRAINFINNILYYSEITENDYKIGEVDLNDVIYIVQQNLHQQIKEREAHIYSEYLPTIFGNQTLLVQLFQNLMSNSLRYTNPNQQPFINISCIEEKGWAKIRITDNGKGMGEKDSRLVFKPFYKGENKESHNPVDKFSSGLGLTIVKRIADFHKAVISVESKIDVGTTIEVDFIN